MFVEEKRKPLLHFKQKDFIYPNGLELLEMNRTLVANSQDN